MSHIFGLIELLFSMKFAATKLWLINNTYGTSKFVHKDVNFNLKFTIVFFTLCVHIVSQFREAVTEEGVLEFGV